MDTYVPSASPVPRETIIEPNRIWFRVNWGEIYEYRDLFFLLVRRDFLSKYKQTVLGPAWFMLQPLLTTLVFTVFFGKVAKVSTDGVPGMLFYLCGMLGWNYFAQNIATGAATFTNNAQLFGKVYFPRLVVPASAVASNAFALVLNLLVYLGFFGWFKAFVPSATGLSIGFAVFWVPLLALQTAALSLGVSLWLSASSAKYRDLTHITPLLLQLWMFATPIIYPASSLPQKMGWINWINPMSAITEGFRYCLLGKATLGTPEMAASFAMTLVVLLSGILIFQKTERTVVDTV